MENQENTQLLHLQVLLTALDDIIFEIDGNLTFKNVWARDESILYMPKEQFLGKKVTEVMSEQAPIFAKAIKETVNVHRLKTTSPA